MSESTKIIDLKAPPRSKILVVEDEKDIASLIEDWLSDTYDVVLAFDGKSAVQKAVWHQPQVVLLDVVMPDMGGYDVVRLLQGSPQTKGIPVIVMTAKNFDDSTVRMIKGEGNVVGFLNKPFKPSELIKTLELILKGERPLAGSSGVSAKEPAPSPVTPVPMPPVASAPEEQTPLPSVVRKSITDKGETPAPSERVVQAVKKAPVSLAKASNTKRSSEEGGASFPWRKRLKRWLGGGLLLMVGVLGVGEYACRKTEEALGVRCVNPPVYPTNRFNSFMPYQWNNPKATVPTFWEEGKVVYQFNQWGLRGSNFPLVTPSGVRRVLLLGGEKVLGWGISEANTIARRLEVLLNKDRPGAYHVINAGFWGASPEDQWAFVKGQGINFKPDSIFWFCEGRPAGTPSTEGLRWLADHRWLVQSPFDKSRLIQVLVRSKIRGPGDSLFREDAPLFKDAEKMAKENRIPLRFWVLPRGEGAIPGGGQGRLPGEIASFYNEKLAEQIAVFFLKKSE